MTVPSNYLAQVRNCLCEWLNITTAEAQDEIDMRGNFIPDLYAHVSANQAANQLIQTTLTGYIGNNGNELVDRMHNDGTLCDGMDADQIAVIAKPMMMKPHWLNGDDFWEDVFYRAEELGYKLKY
jgi:hypothetical protein